MSSLVQCSWGRLSLQYLADLTSVLSCTGRRFVQSVGNPDDVLQHFKQLVNALLRLPHRKQLPRLLGGICTNIPTNW